MDVACGIWQNVKLTAQVVYCKKIFNFYFLIWNFDGAIQLWCYEQWQLWTRLQYVNAQLWQLEGRNVKSGKSADACRRQHTIASRHSILVYQSVSSVGFTIVQQHYLVIMPYIYTLYHTYNDITNLYVPLRLSLPFLIIFDYFKWDEWFSTDFRWSIVRWNCRWKFTYFICCAWIFGINTKQS